ncbi:branched-chain amino acid ABC transporter permease [Propylenella binzhouense]|uniref:Branched-chain amino acid ABC transporter permease n=1 Tax=Propylenella binzhouense TaxID=2555902 RepID=A0A964WSF4_9HYPH|nr:branched-chain amino acid ABC transporter permease [Propylenella binzhouense]MYZ46912.1 branched-chain amino acid ABC transporter permease [Propylenella binzhouense]
MTSVSTSRTAMPIDEFAPSAPARQKAAARPLRWLWLAVAAAVLVYLPFVLHDRAILGYRLSNIQLLNVGLAQLNLTLIAVLGAVSLNYLTGCAGLVSIGHAAFFAVGAMAAAATGAQLGLPFLVSLVAALIAGAAAGVLAGLPSLRVRGLYFVLSTMALHFIVVFAFSEYQYAAFDVFGISYPQPAIGPFALDSALKWYFFLLPIVVLCCLACNYSLKHREGRALLAVRDNEQAASSSGIDVRVLRLKAFAFSSAIASLAGALQAYYLTTVSTELYSLNLAISFIAMIIIGGMGSIAGGVVGALVWLLLPSVLTGFAGELGAAGGGLAKIFVEHRPQVVNLIFGSLVAVLLIFAPGGIVGAARKLTKLVRPGAEA